MYHGSYGKKKLLNINEQMFIPDYAGNKKINWKNNIFGQYWKSSF